MMESTVGLIPRMSDQERVLLAQHLSSAKRVVEYGSGGSTALAFQNGVETLISVESDPAWVKRLLKDPELQAPVARGALTMVYADIGPVGAWGKPISKEGRDRWPEYCRAPWKVIDGADVDFILVDGRFRVACALRSAMNCPNATIGIHDFWDRPQYHVALTFLDWVASADTLGIFRPRAAINRESAETLLARYEYIPS